MDIWQVLMTISVAQIKEKPDRLSHRHSIKAEITLNHNKIFKKHMVWIFNCHSFKVIMVSVHFLT